MGIWPVKTSSNNVQRSFLQKIRLAKKEIAVIESISLMLKLANYIDSFSGCTIVRYAQKILAPLTFCSKVADLDM